MTEEFWANSPFSIARHYGQLQINGKRYVIVNRHGITIFELSDPRSKHYVGDNATKAIEPGEPCDLVREDWIPVYRALGRDRCSELVDRSTSLEDALLLVPEELRPTPKQPKRKRKQS